jgi:peptidoglycan glycosyltransferase
LPVAEPGIRSSYKWELAGNAAERQPRILPIDVATIPLCNAEILGTFGPPVPGAVRMPDLRNLDAQIANDTLTALGITSIYVDLQTRDRIPDVFDNYQPNQVISTIPAQGDWILPGTSVVIGARAP